MCRVRVNKDFKMPYFKIQGLGSMCYQVLFLYFYAYFILHFSHFKSIYMKHEVISFDESKIRKIWHNEEWYFSVVDVIGILTESADPKRYWSVLKVREPQLTTFCSSLKLMATDGKQRLTDCANTEGVLH